MGAKEIKKEWGVVYNDKTIIAVKTPNNDVYPGKGMSIFECDTQIELDTFIAENELKERVM